MNTLVKKKSPNTINVLIRDCFIAVTVCALIGVIMLYSMYKVGIGDIEKRTYIIQLISTGLGIAVCFIIASIDYHHLVKLWFLYAPASIALVLLTFTGLGLQRAGADDRAWLNLGFTTLQPSEFLKLAFYSYFFISSLQR